MLKMALILGSMLALAAPAQAQMNSADVKWGPAPPVFPAGAQMAVLSGDPGKAGTFVIRLMIPAGYKIPAHHHPTDEYLTVISGDFSLGMGDKLDETKSADLTAGGFARGTGADEPLRLDQERGGGAGFGGWPLRHDLCEPGRRSNPPLACNPWSHRGFGDGRSVMS